MLKIPVTDFFPRFFTLLIVVYIADGDVEICTSSGTQVFSFQPKHCAGGVLFSEPLDVKCLVGSSTADKTEWKEDVCGDIAYVPDSSTKVQLMLNLGDDALLDDESCVGIGADKCDLPKQVVSELAMKPLEKNSQEEYVQSAAEAALSQDTAVIDQTERMLKFLHGLLEDPDDSGPALRLKDMLLYTFDIAHSYCYEPWLSHNLQLEMLTAFLFILRESDTNRIKDVTLEENDRIMDALKNCKSDADTDPDKKMTITGSECLTEPKIKSVKIGSNSKVKFRRTNKSFQLNKYDVVVDFTWAMIDFVHGMCFHKFSPHFNSHHLYQQAMERLFTDEVIYRWERPTVLSTSDAWDAVFLGNVRTNIRNLEACIQGAYQGKPYLHRLERMLDTQTKRRKKRSLNDINDLDGAGWCFQTDSERDTAIKDLCPNVTDPTGKR